MRARAPLNRNRTACAGGGLGEPRSLLNCGCRGHQVRNRKLAWDCTWFMLTWMSPATCRTVPAHIQPLATAPPPMQMAIQPLALLLVLSAVASTELAGAAEQYGSATAPEARAESWLPIPSDSSMRMRRLQLLGPRVVRRRNARGGPSWGYSAMRSSERTLAVCCCCCCTDARCRTVTRP